MNDLEICALSEADKRQIACGGGLDNVTDSPKLAAVFNRIILANRKPGGSVGKTIADCLDFCVRTCGTVPFDPVEIDEYVLMVW